MKKYKLLRIFLGESDSLEGKPLYIAILDTCMEKGLSGGTAFRGIAGFGHKRIIHRDRILTLSGDLPVVVEIIGSEDEIAEVMPDLLKIVDGSGLVTIEDIEVIRPENQ